MRSAAVQVRPRSRGHVRCAVSPSREAWLEKAEAKNWAMETNIVGSTYFVDEPIPDEPQHGDLAAAKGVGTQVPSVGLRLSSRASGAALNKMQEFIKAHRLHKMMMKSGRGATLTVT